MATPFDPSSPGARRLARDWVPDLERWEMRVPNGHVFTDGGALILPQPLELNDLHGSMQPQDDAAGR
jgi:hypothetical protein